MDGWLTSAKIVELHWSPKGRLIELDVAGSAQQRGVFMGQAQYDGFAFEKLRVGDRIRVEMVKLPVGCWVWPRYVLPNIRYHNKRAPLRPKELGRNGIVRSKEGDGFPFRIRTTGRDMGVGPETSK